jgi:hypothetical protein
MDGFQAYQTLLIINDLTCADIVHVPAVDGAENRSIAQKLAYF